MEKQFTTAKDALAYLGGLSVDIRRAEGQLQDALESVEEARADIRRLQEKFDEARAEAIDWVPQILTGYNSEPTETVAVIDGRVAVVPVG